MKNESYKQFLPVCNYVQFPAPLMSLWNHSPLLTYGYQLWKWPSLINNGEGNEKVLHNAPYLPPTPRPPKFCITFDFHFSWVLQPSQFKLREPLEGGYNELNKVLNILWSIIWYRPWKSESDLYGIITM